MRIVIIFVQIVVANASTLGVNVSQHKETFFLSPTITTLKHLEVETLKEWRRITND